MKSNLQVTSFLRINNQISNFAFPEVLMQAKQSFSFILRGLAGSSSIFNSQNWLEGITPLPTSLPQHLQTGWGSHGNLNTFPS